MLQRSNFLFTAFCIEPDGKKWAKETKGETVGVGWAGGGKQSNIPQFFVLNRRQKNAAEVHFFWFLKRWTMGNQAAQSELVGGSNAIYHSFLH